MKKTTFTEKEYMEEVRKHSRPVVSKVKTKYDRNAEKRKLKRMRQRSDYE